MSTQSARPVLQRLSCPTCGSPVEQHEATAQTLVCPSCGSYVAIGGGEPSVVGKTKKLAPPPVPIKVGAMITLNGVQYFVLGRVAYFGWDESDRSDTWRWNEWLLGAADGRLLWLSLDEKGFALFKKLRLRAPFDPRRDSTIPVGDGRTARVHERYPAQITGAEGELTWRAAQGENLYMVEAAAFGKRYSVQWTPEELEVYEGDPIDEMALAQAFGDQAWVKRVKAKASRVMLQATIGVICIFFAAVALVLAFLASNTGEMVATQSFQLSTASPIVTFPVEFDQTGRPAIISMRTPNTLPVNSSVDVEVSVTAPNEVKTFLFTKSMWHETGRDDEGPWTDTKYKVSDMFVPTLTGQHQLEFALEDAVAVDGIALNVSVKRNHTFPLWYVVYGVVVGVIGALLLFSSIATSQGGSFMTAARAIVED